MFESFNTKQFGKYLKELRTSLKFTQQDVHNSTGLNLETLRKIEKGITIPRFDTLEILSNVYKVDVLYIFLLHRPAKKVYEFYKSLDSLILENNSERLKSILDDFNNELDEEVLGEIFILDEIEQFRLILKGIESFHKGNKIGAYSNYFIEAMKFTIPSFSVANFGSFKYTQLEYRILLLIALSKCKEGEFKIAIKILKEILTQTLKKTRMDNDDKTMVSKLYFNLSYSFFKLANDKEAITYSSEGIEFCKDNHISYMLPNLYYRRGISKFHIKEDTYLFDLKASIMLFLLIGYEDLAELYCDVTLKKYGISLYEYMI